jgi:hypothetical protein
MYRHFGWIVAVALAACSLACGCSPATSTVTGNVTLDGQPLEKGIIAFSAAEGAAPPVTADIVDGKYSAEMVAGKKHVQLSASKVIGTRKNDSPGAPPDEILEEQIPPKYNSESKLEFDVQPGSNAKDWAVESIRGKR